MMWSFMYLKLINQLLHLDCWHLSSADSILMFNCPIWIRIGFVYVLVWPFGSDRLLYYADSATALPHFVSSAHVGSACLCACRLAAFSHVHHPWRRHKPVPNSPRRISLCMSLPLPSLSPLKYFGRTVEQQRAYRAYALAELNRGL